MVPRTFTHPLLTIGLGVAVCAAAGIARAEDHADYPAGDHDSTANSCESTDAIVESIGTALEVSRKYQDIEVALAEGYRQDGECTFSPEGTMGIHYAHEEKLSAAPDVSNPPILVYLPTADGLKLVALEYLEPVIQDGEPYMGGADEPPRPDSLPDEPPEIFAGQPFDGPMAGHNPNMPWHYDQHVWLYEDNPEGLFAMWNPAIQCPPDSEVASEP